MEIKDILRKSANAKFKRTAIVVDQIDKYVERMENLIANNKSQFVKNKASITLIMLLTGARIGNEKSVGQTCNLKYNENFGKIVDAFGISTLRFKHLNLDEKDIIKLNYIGKKQVEQNYIIKNKILYNYLITLKSDNIEENLFGEISNAEIRKFINKYISKKIVIKDIRTAIASKIFMEKFEEISSNEKPKNKKELMLEFNSILKVVAEQLGNTAAVCKQKYCGISLQEEFINQRSELLSEKTMLGIKKQFKKLKLQQKKTLKKEEQTKN